MNEQSDYRAMPIDLLKYAKKNCKSCFGTGVFGKICLPDGSKKPLACSCALRGYYAVIADDRRDPHGTGV